jgi:GT2 family glycosyltransferase
MRSKLRVLPYVVFLLPLDLLVAMTLFLCIAAGGLKKKLATKGTKGEIGRRPHFPPFVPSVANSPSSHPRCTIVIVSWDGRHLLAECLPSVIDAIQHDGGGHNVLVVDNGSKDGSIEFIREKFPAVQILALDRNYGFSQGNNRGIAKASTDMVVLLNNDMIVDREFLSPLLNGFSDPSVFAVTSQIFFQDATRRREETGKTRARFQDGEFYFWHDEIGPQDEQQEAIPVFWAGGGSCALDRRKFLAIGGFDELYYPFYVEDTDLSYQAWKRGWKNLLAPESRVVHKHRGTSKTRFGNDFVDNTIRRNQYLFIWKNITDLSMILGHIANLPRIHARAMIGEPGAVFEVRAYFRAVRRLRQALQKRLANQAAYRLCDREVLARSQKP